MAIYFSASQVSTSFKRLSSRKAKGKTHLERTSVIMYFLAFDAACKKAGVDKFDLNPDKPEGKSNRKAIELEFTKLVLLDRSHDKITQVSELGKIDRSSKEPEKRISSNFLTVPLKRASDQTDKFFYPKRPAAPLFKMGNSATGLKWGIAYHDDWLHSLPKFLSEIKDSTPFTDLAIFVMRDSAIDGDSTINLVDALKQLITKRFSYTLGRFWCERIEKEQVFARHVSVPYSISHEPFGKPTKAITTPRFENQEKKQLVDYINYLEGVLEANDIQFEYKPKD